MLFAFIQSHEAVVYQEYHVLIVGTRDPTILELNQAASDALLAPKHLAIVPGAAHGYAEPGALQDMAHLAAQWFRRYLDIEGL